MATKPVRTPKGRPENLRPAWKPGQSGNPGGRPKGVAAYFREKYGEDGAPIWDAYYEIAFAKDDKGAYIHQPSVRMQALERLEMRGYGQPVKQVAMTVDDRRETFKGLTDHDLHVRAAELGGQLNGQVH